MGAGNRGGKMFLIPIRVQESWQSGYLCCFARLLIFYLLCATSAATRISESHMWHHLITDNFGNYEVNIHPLLSKGGSQPGASGT
jgi:hypothetical protein